MKALILGIVCVIAGCTTQNPPERQNADFEKQRQAKVEKLNSELMSWHGKDINILIAQMGAPTSTYQMPNGNIMYSFTRSVGEIFCTRSFTADKLSGLIIGSSWKGFCAL